MIQEETRSNCEKYKELSKNANNILRRIRKISIRGNKKKLRN
jgi:hypothetical protein